ncbi:MAG: UDP-N-acetylmuramate--L-alanine ligase [Bacteroidales bacterium]|nr:UDP-N-acetylmuramate--L-alanine ligase [Bacteroidales bacterium]
MGKKIQNKDIYFLGIGGIGMSALARYFHQSGNRVYGYDLTPSVITRQLSAAGIDIHYDENIDKLPEHVDFVVYTPAVPQSHLEYQYFLQRQVPIYKRSQVLGMISAEMPTIGIAGTHGKTTTTSMVATLLHKNLPMLAFIGGIAKNFDSNVVIEDNPQLMVVEADEFDRSFLTLFPKVGIITSMDADHLDIYGDKSKLLESFQLFANQVSDALIVNEKVAHQLEHSRMLVYGLDEQCDYYADEIKLAHNTAEFMLHYREGGEVQSLPVRLSVSGTYNVLNALAAFAAAREFCKSQHIQMTEQDLLLQIGLFNGVKRRFDYRIERDDFVYIDDYAHHPEEIRAFVTAVRKIYPDKKICGIFQPHLYTRTRDFAPQFAEVLSMLDSVILLPIYPARELPIAGITSQYLLDMISSKQKILLQADEVISYVKSNKSDVLLTLGAGNIDRLVPQIEESL